MKKQYSRKHKALRNLVFLLCLVLAMHLLDLYHFTPGAALRDLERELGTGKTETIARAGFTDGLDAVLSGVEDRLLMTTQRWDLLMGWRVDNSQLLRRDADQAVQLEANAFGNTELTRMWMCGWVADPSITELKLRVHCRQWYGVDGEEVDVYLTVTDFQDWQGERVFLMTTREIPATYTLREIYLVTGQGEKSMWRE